MERKEQLVGLGVGQWESSVQLPTELTCRSQWLNASLVFYGFWNQGGSREGRVARMGVALSSGGPQGGGWRRGEGPGFTAHSALQGALGWGGARILLTLVPSAWALGEQAGPHQEGLWSVVRAAGRMSLWPA